jgi:hypothetical protein
MKEKNRLPTIVHSLALYYYYLYALLLSPACEAETVVCPSIGETYIGDDRLDTVDPIKRVSDTSGLAFSPTQISPLTGAPVIFGLGDKGDGERIFVWDSSNGARLLTLHLDARVVTNTDWEAMTIGSCGTLGETFWSCLYVGDFGSNTAGDSGGGRDGRNGVPTRIIRIREPKLEDFDDQDVIPTSYYSILEFDYLHETSPTIWANCETMFIDHTGWGTGGSTGDVYLVTKWGGRKENPNADFYTKTRVFKIPVTAWPTSDCASVATYSPEAVGEYELNLTEANLGDYAVTSGQLFGKEWRGGEMSFEGTLIGLGTREDAHIFLRWYVHVEKRGDAYCATDSVSCASTVAALVNPWQIHLLLLTHRLHIA